MMQQEFATRAVRIVEKDDNVTGLAVAGSWITDELDEYSDLDLVLVTEEKIAGSKTKMLAFARKLGELISGFTGEHVGEPRLLICLYDNPLLHVDIKFLTLQEFKERVENPVVLFERNGSLSNIISTTKPEWPRVDFQWIEDRFWTWIHYLATKVARGELFECIDGLCFLRARVLTPLMQVKAKKLPRGVRKAEMQLNLPDLENLKITLPQYDKESVVKAIDNTISIYRSLRRKLYPDNIELQTLAEKRSIEFFKKIKS
ncbi:MAG: nucleotidyltransferase domain-containing protein [Chitinophagaceae bacterium]|nr:nucleotidyltransferase domain-containing protein [Chitinophagaceae bacterium]